MNLPKYFIQFWYPHALLKFLLSTANALKFIDEDLAVSLMAKLIFVPLFHDSSIIGRAMSLIFRSVRILFGLFAMLLATLLIWSLAIIWLIAPLVLILIFLPVPIILIYLLLAVFLFGLSLFVQRLLQHPHLKVWQIKSGPEIWQATRLKPSQVIWSALISSHEVGLFLTLLELSPAQLAPQTVELTDQIKEKVYRLAKATHAEYITASYFFVAIFLSLEGIDKALLKFNLKPEDLTNALIFFEQRRSHWRHYYLWDEEFAVRHLKGVNRGWLGAPTPALDSVSVDLTKQAAQTQTKDFIGRENVVHEVTRILSQGQDRNVLLIGQPGSGRSTLVEYLAKMIVTGDAPDSLATKRLVGLDLSRLLSGVQTGGDLASRIKAIFEEVASIENIIIYVDEIQNLGIGEISSSFNVYSLMQPYLESDRFQFLASCEESSYAKILERNPVFARIFHTVKVPPATGEETIQIIEEEAILLARYSQVVMSYMAIKTLVQLAQRLIHNRVLPDSALFILDECKTSVVNSQITSDVVKSVVQQQSDVPIFEANQDQKKVLLHLEWLIHQQMIDQEDAVNRVADVLRRSATGLREQNRPIGSFLFVGPTGVGKTELAKILSELYFKGKKSFLRFDMSEYQTPEAVDRLLGSSQSPGELTEAIEHKPYCLLLLDEFEKANPQILNLFLQVLDDGRLTSFEGRTVDFTNTIIIATSNAASLTIAQGLENNQTIQELAPTVKAELLTIFKPELINRFDEVVIFKPLSDQDLEQIVKIRLQELVNTLKEQGYLVEFSPELISQLAKKGYDPALGARPLRRMIQDTIEAKLSRLILEGKLTKGETFVADQNLL